VDDAGLVERVGGLGGLPGDRDDLLDVAPGGRPGAGSREGRRLRAGSGLLRGVRAPDGLLLPPRLDAGGRERALPLALADLSRDVLARCARTTRRARSRVLEAGRVNRVGPCLMPRRVPSWNGKEEVQKCQELLNTIFMFP
jgi:hypothetical protein